MTLILVPPGAATAGETVPLDDDEQHHLKVRRVAAGSDVEFTDGAGHLGLGRLVGQGRGIALEVLSVRIAARPVPLVLGVGAGDRDRFGWLVEKATELGVTEIVPLETARTRGVASGLRPEQLARLRRRAREALKQCGSAWVPELRELEPPEAFVERASSGVRWLLDAAGAAPSGIDPALPAFALVGPEGGLTDAERDLARQHGFTPVSAGPHTLRFETAALGAAILVQAARLAAGPA